MYKQFDQKYYILLLKYLNNLSFFGTVEKCGIAIKFC